MSLVVDYYENGELREGFNADDLWRIFYDFMVSKATLAIIHTQSKKLLAASHSFDSWKTSRYGRFLQFVSEETYCEVTRCWQEYADFADPTRQSSPKVQAKYSQIRHRIRKIRNDRVARFEEDSFETSESMGPFKDSKLGTVSRAMSDYWRTGVVGDSDATDIFLDKSGEGLPNPLFSAALHSSQGWDCHDTTDPLKSFYFADSLQEFHDKNEEPEAGEFAKSARAQFLTWIQSFSQYVDNDRVVVRFWSAEALAACLTLRARLKAGSGMEFILPYARPWSVAQMDVDASMHTDRFNVIESSDLVDCLGLLNVLTACRPLLLDTPDVALFSKTLLRPIDGDKPAMQTLLPANIKEIGVLFNLVPLGCLTGVQTTSTLSETDKSGVINGPTQIIWKVPGLGDGMEANNRNQQRTYVNSQQLFVIVYRIYSKMFDDEKPDVYKQNRFQAQHGGGLHMNYYNKAAIVGLIQTVRLKVNTDWKAMMDLLLQMIWTDGTRGIGSGSFQEVCVLCQLAKLADHEDLRVPPRHGSLSSFGRLRAKSINDFLIEENLPAIGYITLVVPRTSVAKLTAIEGKPVLQARVRQIKGPSQLQHQSIFSMIHCMFGKLDEPRCNHDRCVMYESEQSWNGTSDLVVCFRVSIQSLLLGPEDGIRVALHLGQTDSGSLAYERSLGTALCVFEAELSSPSVKITRNHTVRVTDIDQSPKLDTNVVSGTQNLHLTDTKLTSRVTASMHSPESIRLQYRLDVREDIKASKAITSGKRVNVIDVSPCLMYLSFGNSCPRGITFPMPISRVNYKVQMAKESQRVEVSAAVSLAGEPDGYSACPFPVIVNFSSPSPSLMPWSLPYVPLDKCSKIPLGPSMDFAWTSHILAIGKSDAEWVKSRNAPSPITQLKSTLATIFRGAVGRQNGHKDVFYTRFVLSEVDNLKNISRGNILIMVDAIRHDPASQCIVLDAYIVHMTMALAPDYEKAIARWRNSSESSGGICIKPEVTPLLKHFLLACAERCRTYPHKETCEYKTDGVPRSLQADKPTFCSCGEGNVSASFLANDMYAPFANIATRVAVPPLFAVPYVEKCFGCLRGGSTVPQQSKAATNTKHGTGLKKKCLDCGKGMSDGFEWMKCAKCIIKAAFRGRACRAED